MIIKFFFYHKTQGRNTHDCMFAQNISLTLGRRNECFLLSNICSYQISFFSPLIFVNYLFFFSYVSQSAVLRKPNIYKEIDVSKFICACIITGGS